MLGSGIIKGLAVTAKNFVGSYYDPARMTTVEYPEQPTVLPENYRNFPFLVSENATDPMGTLRCVACQICEKECPPQCIIIEKSKDKKPDANGKMQLYPAVFGIDTSVCMSCQICVEVCPFDAIKMDKVFEIAATDRFLDLYLNREQLAKPNTYYHQIHPEEAAEVDGRLTADRKAAEEKAKATAAAKAAAPVAAPKPADSAVAPKPASPAVKPQDEPRRLVSPKPGEGGSPLGEGGPAKSS
ncbi:MAG: 4Fe-4S dicluster domain-containing protein [Lacunisphaera sp.]|nr:4Fe-4S dicluster domain-containing protein [Lacunisphaera sp.]